MISIPNAYAHIEFQVVFESTEHIKNFFLFKDRISTESRSEIFALFFIQQNAQKTVFFSKIAFHRGHVPAFFSCLRVEVAKLMGTKSRHFFCCRET